MKFVPQDFCPYTNHGDHGGGECGYNCEGEAFANRANAKLQEWVTAILKSDVNDEVHQWFSEEFSHE